MRWPVITAEGASIRDAIARIDRSEGREIVVVDDQRRLVGTATSERLRRELIDGATPTTPVSSVVDEPTPERAVDNGPPGDATTALEHEAPDDADSESNGVETVLVVGGAGYVGSVLCRTLLESGFAVRVLDPLMYGDAGVAGLADRERFTLHRGDARSIETVLDAIEGVDAVVHLGGIVGDPATELDPRKTLEYNLHSTRVLASVCKYHQLNRFVFASSCSVYGKSEDGAGRLTEDDALNPVSLYARLKIQSERVLRDLADERFSPTILRKATVYGYSPRMRFDLVGNVLPAKAYEQGVIPVFGGDQYRPNVHVEDAARAYVDCLTAPLEDVAGEVFNVGSNQQNYRIDELATVVADAFPAAEIEYHDERTDERSYRVEFEKIRSTLGFEPERSVRDHCLELKAAFESGAFPAYTATRFNNRATLESAPSFAETAAVIGEHEPLAFDGPEGRALASDVRSDGRQSTGTH
ncbi:NAD-dependent epimerase/dehydratase family protein [Natronococcus wangiae]|uniref:NAD-dependent epimerase/dehydratase family protein n=1 Tax=Natronococcus wangiae TaxID=3068275 RepID=UPI00273D354D|nr:NAD-dependent epimerase/dehydratase family protein [Natronococcus sp. AD5]